MCGCWRSTAASRAIGSRRQTALSNSHAALPRRRLPPASHVSRFSHGLGIAAALRANSCCCKGNARVLEALPELAEILEGVRPLRRLALERQLGVRLRLFGARGEERFRLLVVELA